MKRWFLLLLTGILCLGLMSSCSVEDHKEIREHTDQMLEALIRGSEEEAYAKVSHLCSRGEFSPIFSSMKEMLGSTDSYTLKPIGIQSRWENGVSSQTVRYLMITEENSFEVETSLSQGKLYGFHLYHNTTVPLSGSFGTLMNSNPFQIFLLIISVLEIALIFFAAVDAIRHKIEHRILWVCLETDKGMQRKCLEIGKAPIVTFALSKEKPVSVSAYCNLHGLWKANI